MQFQSFLFFEKIEYDMNLLISYHMQSSKRILLKKFSNWEYLPSMEEIHNGKKLFPVTDQAAFPSNQNERFSFMRVLKSTVHQSWRIIRNGVSISYNRDADFTSYAASLQSQPLMEFAAVVS